VASGAEAPGSQVGRPEPGPVLQLDGGAFAAGSLSAVTEISNGIYAVNFAASDLNGNTVILRATAAGCDDALERVITQ